MANDYGRCSRDELTLIHGYTKHQYRDPTYGVLDVYLSPNKDKYAWDFALHHIPLLSIFGIEQSSGPFSDFLTSLGAKPRSAVEVPTKPTVRNNDGRATCAQCGAPTRNMQMMFSVAQVCTKCGF